VDVVLDDPYKLPFADQSVDVCVSTSCLEHSEFFWLLFQEVLRTLKPTGLFYLNAPSNGSFHRYPVDCWRFYPDSGIALQNWGRRVGYDCALLESFVGHQGTDEWNDFVAVFVKDRAHAARFPQRMSSRGVAFTNGLVLEKGLNVANFSGPTQDQHAQHRLRALLKMRAV
jgi:SAM-dependent methyltransferase